MKPNLTHIVLMLFVLLDLACTPRAEKVDGEKARLEAREHDFNKDFVSFRAEGEKRITENKSLLLMIKVQNKSIRGEERTSAEKTVETLERKNQELKKQLKSYRFQGLKHWEDFKNQFTRDTSLLGRTLRDMKVKKGKPGDRHATF